MRSILVIVLLLVLAVAALGFYLDWFHFTTTTDPESGKVKASVEIDQNKIKSDAEKAKEKVGGASPESPSRQ